MSVTSLSVPSLISHVISSCHLAPSKIFINLTQFAGLLIPGTEREKSSMPSRKENYTAEQLRNRFIESRVWLFKLPRLNIAPKTALEMTNIYET